MKKKLKKRRVKKEVTVIEVVTHAASTSLVRSAHRFEDARYATDAQWTTIDHRKGRTVFPSHLIDEIQRFTVRQ